MGVNLFRDSAPHEFGVFTLGLYSMFRLTAGETQVQWPQSSYIMFCLISFSICERFHPPLCLRLIILARTCTAEI